MRKAVRKFRKDYIRRREKMKAKGNQGFTLVELLVAIVILSLVVVPTMTVFITATKSNSKARTELQATITANSVLESAKAFSLYVFDQQCNTIYTSSNASKFALIAGTTTDSFVSSAYGGTVGTVVFDGTKVDSVEKRDSTTPFVERDSKYAYALNGIKQSSSTYDALIVFEEADYQDVEINGSTFTEGDVGTVYAEYNKEYTITIYVYKHNKTGNPEYIGKDLAVDDGALVVITGSKIDPARKPD